MNNADFWASVRTIIAEGFTPEGLLKLHGYAEQYISGRLVYQRFRRENSMAAQRAVQQMSLHPDSREQKIAQIQMLRRLSASSKENANAERSRKSPFVLLIATSVSTLLNCAKEERGFCQRKSFFRIDLYRKNDY